MHPCKGSGNGGHQFYISILYTHPNASDFVAIHTRGPNTVIVPHSYFHDPDDGQNSETCPISDPSIVQPSNPKSQGQSQSVETATNLCHNDSSTRASESSTDIDTEYEPTHHPPSGQSDTLQ